MTDIFTGGGGGHDVMTIGTYEALIRANNGWLVSLGKGMADDWDASDLLPAIAGGLTVDDRLCATPVYGESSLVMFRTDPMEKAGLDMPDAPTWDFIRQAAAAMTDRDNDINGICARGKAGWGENMAFLTAMSNSFGATGFDEDWTAQFDSPEWAATIIFYLDLMNASGPADAANNGVNENPTLFQQGECGMWIDATVAASFVTGPNSTVADSVGYAPAHDNRLGKRGKPAPGMVADDPVFFPEAGSGQDLHLLGERQGLYQDHGRQRKLGQRPSGHAPLALWEPERSGRGTFCENDTGKHPLCRPDRSVDPAGALHRRPVRGDPRVRSAGGIATVILADIVAIFRMRIVGKTLDN